MTTTKNTAVKDAESAKFTDDEIDAFQNFVVSDKAKSEAKAETKEGLEKAREAFFGKAENAKVGEFFENFVGFVFEKNSRNRKENKLL